MTPKKSIIRWHGAKWRIAPWVLSHFPPHKVYVEPFGGSAAVLLQKERALTEVYNDLDGEIVNMFQVIRRNPEKLAAQLAMTPYARDEYDGLYEEVADDIERARRFIARSFMGMFSKGALEKSGFDARTNADGYTGRLRAFVEVPEHIMAVAGRFSHVLIENKDASAICARYDRPDALIYLDPPYVPETRSGKYYRHEMSDDDHSKLLDLLIETEAMVVISGYQSELYRHKLGSWHSVEIAAYTDGASQRTEVLWMNDACVSAKGMSRDLFSIKSPEVA